MRTNTALSHRHACTRSNGRTRLMWCFFVLGIALWRSTLPVPMQGVVVEDFRPLSRLDGCLWSLAETLWETCRRPRSPGASFVEGIGTALAARVLERQFHPNDVIAKAPAVLSQSVLKRLVSHVESHLDGGISVEDLARQAGLCESHFARIVQERDRLFAFAVHPEMPC